MRRRLTKSKSLLSPPPISPIAAPSEEQNEHEDNENEIHIFLQMSGGKISHLHMWVQNNYSPASDSTYYYFDGAVMRLSTFRVYRSRPRPDTVAYPSPPRGGSGERVSTGEEVGFSLGGTDGIPRCTA